jgi:hypothetical protein
MIMTHQIGHTLLLAVAMVGLACLVAASPDYLPSLRRRTRRWLRRWRRDEL